MEHPRRGVPLLALLALCAQARPSPIAGQEGGAVGGLVTDASSGAPLSAAQVFIPGTDRGTLTDDEGRYRLSSVPAGPRRITVLLLGYAQQSRSVDVVAGQSIELDFTLRPSAIALDEILVTVTGERRKAELGNAVAEIQASEIAQVAPVTNAYDLLQARAPGVQVMNTGGGAGIGSRIRIRGSNSLSLSNEPIVYLDGVRVESGSLAWLSTGGQDLGRMNDLNPEEIESIEVVKGPSAATLYGTQAANGVIRITTKKGRNGPPRWTAYSEAGAVYDPYTYPDNYVAFDAGGTPCLLASTVSGLCQIATVSHYQPLEDERFTIFGTGWRQQHGLTVSGGSDRVNYFVSGEWEKEIGPYELKDVYRRYLDSLGYEVKGNTRRPQQLHKLSLRANLSVNFAENAVLSLNTGWIGSRTDLTFNDNTQYSAVRLGYLGAAVRPESDGYDPTIWYAGRGPEVLFSEDFYQDVGRYTVSTHFNWSPLRWLEVRALLGMDQVQQDEVDSWPAGLDQYNPESGRIVAQDRILQHTADLGATGTFQLSSALSGRTSVGAQFLREYRHGYGIVGVDLAGGAESVGAASLLAGAVEGTSESRTLGLFVEEQLSWSDLLFVTGALRFDDNSAFGKDFDAIFYPKLSASWLVSQQDWFPNLPGVDRFRIRTAWGMSGLQPNQNAAITTFRPTQVDGADGTLGGVVMASLGNPDLRPEKSTELEIGFDGDFLGGRLGVELTHYRKKSQDALVLRTLPPSTGAQSQRWENLASVENRGLEAGIRATLFASSDLGWNVNLNGSVNHNKILDFGEGVAPPSENYREGYPGGSVWAEPILSFTDANGDGVISGDEVVVGEEEVFLGPMIPEKGISLHNDLTFRDLLRLDVLLDYQGGFVVNNITGLIRCAQSRCRARWDPATPQWDQARVVAPTTAGYYEDGDFLKLREASLTFFVPSSWATRIGTDRLSLTITGRNLATWSDYSGTDPEINSYGVGTTGESAWGNWDWNAQAPFRYWTARVSASF